MPKSKLPYENNFVFTKKTVLFFKNRSRYLIVVAKKEQKGKL